MIGQKITIKSHRTDEEIVVNDHTDPENVIALQQYPSFQSDIKNNNVDRQGAHGEFNLPNYYSGMSITLDGIIVGENESNVWDIKNKLDRILSLPERRYWEQDWHEDDSEYPPMFENTVRLLFATPDGRDRWIDATPVREPQYDRNLKETFRLDFQIILRANIPFLVIDPDPADEVTLSLGSVREGMKLPFGVPFDLSGEFLQNEQTINVNEKSFTRVTMNGSDDGVLINPQITNLTNGSYVKIDLPLSGTSQFFEIDGLYKSMVDHNGKDVTPYSQGDYLVLEKGDNKLVYTAEDVIPN